MFNLDQRDYPKRALNILNELQGADICDALEILDWCKEGLLHQPSSSWSAHRTDDNKGRIIADSRNPRQN